MADILILETYGLQYFLVTVLSAFVLYLLSFNYFKRLKSELYKIPSPSGVPILGHILKIVTAKEVVKTFLEVSSKFPHYYRIQIGPFFPLVVLTSPETVEKLLSSNDEAHLTKADQYAAVADYLDDGLITSNGSKWRNRRKLFNPLFNYKCFPHFLEVFNRHSKDLVHRFDKVFADSTSKPIQAPLYESLLKIISETAMGVELNDSTEEFHKFFEEAERTKEYIFWRATRPWLCVDWIWKLHPFRRVYEENMRYIKGYMLNIVREARWKFSDVQAEGPGQNKHKTVMDVMLETGLTNSEIREEAHTIISAGHETSGAALQFTLMLLALNPEHQNRCREEIDEIITNEAKCPNGDFTLLSIADLKYSERCIKEALRLYPIANVTGRKIKAPLRLDENVVLPKDTTCLIITTDIHRNPEIYPEPDKFDPSRFTPENCTARHPYAYFPFSGGPRICLGSKFAMVQMKLILARILHHFTVETTDKIENVPLDMSCVMTPVRGYNFLLKKRNAIPK